MKAISSFLKKTFVTLLVLGLLYGLVEYYSYIFARTVVGRIDKVARVTGVTAMIGGSRALTDSQLHLFSVSIRQPDGGMVTATSEDGQWAIAKEGLCVKAKYYPHPPWNLKQAGTYFNARMLSMADCESRAAQEMGIDAAAYAGVPLNPAGSSESSSSPSHAREAGGKEGSDTEAASSGPAFSKETPVSSTPVPPPSMEQTE